MISKKIFAADGSNIRFLSDFIIRSEQFTRVYNYIFDENGVEGDIDPISGLFIRVSDVPNSADLVTIDRWDLVDNSISFYIPPYASSRVYIEVATTSEEFGDTLVQPSVERAEEAARAAEAAQAAAEAAQAASEAAQALAATSQIAAAASQAAAALSESNAGDSEAEAAASAAAALASQAAALASESEATAQAAASAASAASSLASSTASAASANESQVFAWEAEAERLTADSYATQTVDVFVNIYTSNGNGTFTATPTTSYSALHWSTKMAEALVIVPTPVFPADEGLALVAHSGGNNWEKILGLPLETGNQHKTVTTLGVEGDSFWSPIVTSPNIVSENFTLGTGANGSIVSPTINDGVTVTVPDGSTLVIL